MIFKTSFFLLTAISLVGCGSDTGTTDSGTTGDSGATLDSGTGGTTESCTVFTEGDWEVTGSAVGMTMTGTLTLDPDGCSFAFSDWNMGMDSPEGGTVVGDTVTLNGNSGSRDWSECSGTASDANTASIQCADGATVNMVYDG
jgi:hypothetical protein